MTTPPQQDAGQTVEQVPVCQFADVGDTSRKYPTDPPTALSR